ncbi:hypothetical protein [Sphingopyxis sp. R3-92]|uniref:hypothetical protein n=1 Tax=Sphingopyxis sp. R3-92 TaxID=3158553 RepID=UPI003EE43505
MNSAAIFAMIPDFLRFDVGEIELNMGGAHGDYARLERCVTAPLSAIAGQLISSAPGNLDALKGDLVILEAVDEGRDWNGSIRRSAFTDHESNHCVADYMVRLDLSSDAFDRLLTLMNTGRVLSGLSLDFQNIDGPLVDDPLDRPIPWDDLGYPHVAVTNFTLRWR